MRVVPITKYRARDVGVLLQHLLARWEAGDLKGLAICSKDQYNIEDVSFAGEYRDNPAQALGAALRISRRINQLQDELEMDSR